MYRATIISPVTGDGTDASPYRPAFADAFAVSWTDVTGARFPADPSASVYEVVCDAATLDALDAAYVVLEQEAIVAETTDG